MLTCALVLLELLFLEQANGFVASYHLHEDALGTTAHGV